MSFTSCRVSDRENYYCMISTKFRDIERLSGSRLQKDATIVFRVNFIVDHCGFICIGTL